MDETEGPLSRTAASAAVADAGWRFLLGSLRCCVPVDGMAAAAQAAGLAVQACGDEADGHLQVDLRADRVELGLQTRRLAAVTDRDVALAGRVTTAVATVGPTVPVVAGHPVQLLEVAVDALDIAAVRPFWAAVLGYGPEPGDEGPEGALVDPAGRLPSVWFQQMDAARPQRNRLHLDLTLPHDLAEERVAAVLAAGGVLGPTSQPRAFWVLVDPEGNEVCVCTWQDRDEPPDAKM
ncbi:MAG: VOC family protein [Motilibacteraceae bacterium]